MKFTEFKLGEIFWTGAGRWKCFDIGVAANVIVAAKWEKIDVPFMVSKPKSLRYRICKFLGLSPFKREIRTIDPEAETPVHLHYTIFFDYDWDGCWATKAEYDEICQTKISHARR